MKYLLIFFITFPISAKTHYVYKDRKHSLGEEIGHLSLLYGVGWSVYYLTQTDEFRNHGSLRKYRDNFGRLVFDQDEPIWNWVGHPYTGSQIYLYYRGTGHSRLDAFKMTFIQSALFEFFIEVYTEPTSIQDLYQTPVYGAAVGVIFEIVSLKLLNSPFLVANILGHIMNPTTLLWFYEGTVRITPQVPLKPNSPYGLTLNVSF